MTGPGWYPDPQQPAQLRWFDGQQWSAHTQPPAPPALPSHPPGYVPAGQQPGFAPAVQTTVVQAAPQKSVGVALLLTFFFGPLGMLYSTVLGGLVMLGLDVVLGILTFGLWFIISWPIQMVWAALAASEARNVSSTQVRGELPATEPGPHLRAATHVSTTARRAPTGASESASTEPGPTRVPDSVGTATMATASRSAGLA